MRNFNPEVHRDNIRKVENVPESEWTMVQRKVKKQYPLFIPCNRNGCNSKIHNADKCWWINPAQRPNYQISIEPTKGSKVLENNNQRIKKPPDCVYRSSMLLHHDYIKSLILIESNLQIRFFLEIYRKGISAFLTTMMEFDDNRIENIYNIAMKYLEDKLRLMRIHIEETGQDTGQFNDPEPRPELRPLNVGKLCTRSQDNNTIEIVSDYVQKNRNSLRLCRIRNSSSVISKDTYLSLLKNIRIHRN